MVRAVSNEAHDRARLGFAETVAAKFGFLASEYGMTMAAEPTIVRCAGNGVLVNIWHGRQSYEIGLDIGRVGGTGRNHLFHMVDLLAAADGHEKAADYHSYAATTKESVEAGLAQMALDLQRCGVTALRGKRSTFEQMSELQRERARRFADKVNGRQVRADAAEAWTLHNFGKVAALLGSIEPLLSAAELGRLEYARKHQ